VDLPIAGAAVAAHRVHQRPARQVDLELALDGLLKSRAVDVADQALESAVDLQSRWRMRTGAGHGRVVAPRRVQRLAMDEVAHHHVLEGVRLQGGGVELVESEAAAHGSLLLQAQC